MAGGTEPRIMLLKIVPEWYGAGLGAGGVLVWAGAGAGAGVHWTMLTGHGTRVLDTVVDLVTVLQVGRVLVNLSIDLMTRTGLLLMLMHVVCDEYVIRLLHHVGVVLKIITLNVLGRSSSLTAVLDNDSDDDNDDDDHDDATHTPDDDGPLHLVTGQLINVDSLQRSVITRCPLNNVSALRQLPQPQHGAVAVERNSWNIF